MASETHARNTENGMRFRVWSTSEEKYLTGELTEMQLRDWRLMEAVREATERYERHIDEHMQRASTKGTSSRDWEAYRDMDGPWDTDSQ